MTPNMELIQKKQPNSLIRNGQGDIMGLIDSSGRTVIEYRYDTWGKDCSYQPEYQEYLDLQELNPFRYRGYVYDTETGWYYLQSRYYDPEVGRFISADVFLSTGQGVLGYNTYAYCLNNPVNRIDGNGFDSKYIDLGAGWSVQIHDSGEGRQHIHIWNRRLGKEYSQNDDGSPHDKHRTERGKLPKWLQKKVKELTGWDYNGNRREFFRETTSETVFYADGSSAFNTMFEYEFADGTKIRRKNNPLLNTVNSMENIYYEGSNVMTGDICVIDFFPSVFFTPVFDALPVMPEFHIAPAPLPVPIF